MLVRDRLSVAVAMLVRDRLSVVVGMLVRDRLSVAVAMLVRDRLSVVVAMLVRDGVCVCFVDQDIRCDWNAIIMHLLLISEINAAQSLNFDMANLQLGLEKGFLKEIL